MKLNGHHSIRAKKNGKCPQAKSISAGVVEVGGDKLDNLSLLHDIL